MNIDIVNKNILIIGAGDGVGRKLIEILNSNNSIIAVTRTASKLDSVQCEKIEANLSNKEDILHAIDFVINKYNKIDIFILIAADSIVGGFCDYLDNDIETLITTNIVNTTYVLQKIIKHMMQFNDGTIVCMSSISSRSPFPFNSLYGASKAYLNKLIEDINEEVKGFNIKINGVAPGIIDTSFLDKISFYNKDIGQFVKDSNKLSIQDVCNLFIYLLSDQSNHISGQIIEIDV